jgi:hypothetical protein
MAPGRHRHRAGSTLLVGARLKQLDRLGCWGLIMSRLFAGLVAIALLWASTAHPVAAAPAAPGSIDPVPAAPVTPPAASPPPAPPAPAAPPATAAPSTVPAATPPASETATTPATPEAKKPSKRRAARRPSYRYRYAWYPPLFYAYPRFWRPHYRPRYRYHRQYRRYHYGPPFPFNIFRW